MNVDNILFLAFIEMSNKNSSILSNKFYIYFLFNQ